jgi:hypothetical protein
MQALPMTRRLQTPVTAMANDVAILLKSQQQKFFFDG